MFRKILLVYNESYSGVGGLRLATSIAKQSGAELHILGIVPTSGGFAIAVASGGADVCGKKREMIEQALAAADTGEDWQGVPHVITIREGDPAVQIVAHAKAIKADLVVMSHTDRGRLTRWFVGSTAETLLQHLPCSLLIAQ